MDEDLTNALTTKPFHKIIRVHYRSPEKSIFEVCKIHSSLPEFF